VSEKGRKGKRKERQKGGKRKSERGVEERENGVRKER
jgi:hypothetical protein